MLSSEEVRQLERLAIGSSSGAPTAAASGLRQVRARGLGVEFQDYRRYQPGDDPRSIDWTVEARFRQLFIRVCRAEGHVRLHLLLDVSGSMAVGSPQKLACARKIAAALCYVAIERRDAVAVATFNDAIQAHVAPATGRPQIFRVFGTLAAANAFGRSRIDRALIDYATAVRGGGLAVVISDFFQAESAIDGLRCLLYRGLTPAIVQVVAHEELEPAIHDEHDEVELVDIEDPGGPAVTVDASALQLYRKNVARVSAELSEFCTAHGLPWFRVESSASFDTLLRVSVQAGLLAVCR